MQIKLLFELSFIFFFFKTFPLQQIVLLIRIKNKSDILKVTGKFRKNDYKNLELHRLRIRCRFRNKLVKSDQRLQQFPS